MIHNMRQHKVEKISVYFSPLRAPLFAWMYFTVHYHLSSGHIFKRDFLQTRENMIKYMNKPTSLTVHEKSFDGAKLGIPSPAFNLTLYM